ncbi:SLC13 family permease [Pararhizobium haloflavum]|uniref:SLC13 family permease n=1 Tax=Pararhizobium haloflavum TaxID=2037914 RepID=UPI000C1A1B73|nr:SLC13 family permease [Pararhizobium haloflavum]
MGDIHLWATYAVVALSIIGYALERLPLEAVAIASLAALLVLFGLFPYSAPDGTVLSADRLLVGFANPALITVLALLIVGQGLFATDAMEAPARYLGRLGGASSERAMIIVLVSAGVLSAFLNNTPVVVIFIPILTVIAAQRAHQGYKVFMPLSFITILGGMTTLMGSSTNLIAAGVAREYGIPIGFFDITAMGAMLAVVGGTYVLFIMPRLLKERHSPIVRETQPSGTQFIGEITLSADHPYIGMEAKGGMFPALSEMTLRLLIRRDVPFLPPYDAIALEEGDRLVVTGTRKAFSQALATGSKDMIGIVTEADIADADPDSRPGQRPGPDYHLAEAVIAPGSRFAGRTIQMSGIRAALGVAVLGVQRKSRMARSGLAAIRLEPGDTLLLGGTSREISNLRGNHDILLLEHSAEPVPQTRKAIFAVWIFIWIVLLSAFEAMPIVAASVIGAALMLAAGCLTLHQASRAFDRQIFLLVGSSIAMATAMEATGGAALIAEGAVTLFADSAPAVVLSAMFLVIAIMTNILSNNATAVLFTPIMIGIAERVGVPSHAFVVAVIFAANASFATPIGYQTNLLVMGPGHYRFSDFLKAGGPLVLIIWLTFSLLAPWYYDL